MITNAKTAHAIETHYAGYRMRSRLEARWTVFLDAMNYEWQYEAEGFELPSGRYLPDFWLPRVNMFAECKPTVFSDTEFHKAAELCVATGRPVLLLDGPPDTTNYWMMEVAGEGCVGLEDFLWECGGHYWSENRFYVGTGETNRYPKRTQWRDLCYGSYDGDCLYEHAVKEARSARFGERQEWYAQRRAKAQSENQTIERLREKYGL